MYDHTYPNLIAETRPHGLTKSAAVTQFLELRSPLYGNRYIDDRPIDCIHRVDEDPRQVYNARPYPKNMIHSVYHLPRRTYMDSTGFMEFDRTIDLSSRQNVSRSAPHRLTLRAATMKEQKKILQTSALIQNSMRDDYANRNSHHASVKPWVALKYNRSPAGTCYAQGASNISPSHRGLSPAVTGFR